MPKDPTQLVLDAVDQLVHARHGGSYPALLQSCLLTNYFGDAMAVAAAMERARLSDVDGRIRSLVRNPEPWLVLCQCKEAILDMERETATVALDSAVGIQLGKLKRVVNKALEKEVGDAE